MPELRPYETTTQQRTASKTGIATLVIAIVAIAGGIGGWIALNAVSPLRELPPEEVADAWTDIPGRIWEHNIDIDEDVTEDDVFARVSAASGNLLTEDAIAVSPWDAPYLSGVIGNITPSPTEAESTQAFRDGGDAFAHGSSTSGSRVLNQSEDVSFCPADIREALEGNERPQARIAFWEQDEEMSLDRVPSLGSYRLTAGRRSGFTPDARTGNTYNMPLHAPESGPPFNDQENVSLSYFANIVFFNDDGRRIAVDTAVNEPFEPVWRTTGPRSLLLNNNPDRDSDQNWFEFVPMRPGTLTLSAEICGLSVWREVEISREWSGLDNISGWPSTNVPSFNPELMTRRTFDASISEDLVEQMQEGVDDERGLSTFPFQYQLDLPASQYSSRGFVGGYQGDPSHLSNLERDYLVEGCTSMDGGTTWDWCGEAEVSGTQGDNASDFFTLEGEFKRPDTVDVIEPVLRFSVSIREPENISYLTNQTNEHLAPGRRALSLDHLSPHPFLRGTFRGGPPGVNDPTYLWGSQRDIDDEGSAIRFAKNRYLAVSSRPAHPGTNHVVYWNGESNIFTDEDRERSEYSISFPAGYDIPDSLEENDAYMRRTGTSLTIAYGAREDDVVVDECRGYPNETPENRPQIYTLLSLLGQDVREFEPRSIRAHCETLEANEPGAVAATTVAAVIRPAQDQEDRTVCAEGHAIEAGCARFGRKPSADGFERADTDMTTALILPANSFDVQATTLQVLVPEREILDQDDVDDLIDDVEDDDAADELEDNFPGFNDPLGPPDQPGIDPVGPGLGLPDFDPRDIPEGVLDGDPDLIINPEIIHRGANRVIVRFDDPRDTAERQAQDISFLYAANIPGVEPGQDGHQSAEVRTDDEGMYVVLEDLLGGGFDDADAEEGAEEDELVNGRKDYYFQVRVGEERSNILRFLTLNRRQAILYIYGLVFGDEFSAGFEDEIAEGFDYNALRGGGPAFFYNPPGEESLSLAGVKYALMNDPLGEFDIRLFFTARATSVEESVEQLYRVVFDRIYPEDLSQICDATGCGFWAEQVEQNNADRITLSGVKFALFNSTEYRNTVRSAAVNDELANAELAYQYVLRRGADLDGRQNLAGQGDSVEDLRILLTQSDEFETRLNDTEEDEGRRAAINELYEAVFGRASDVEGLDYWTTTRSDLEVLEVRDTFLEGE